MSYSKEAYMNTQHDAPAVVYVDALDRFHALLRACHFMRGLLTRCWAGSSDTALNSGTRRYYVEARGGFLLAALKAEGDTPEQAVLRLSSLAKTARLAYEAEQAAAALARRNLTAQAA